jgi:hypothetical protein
VASFQPAVAVLDDGAFLEALGPVVRGVRGRETVVEDVSVDDDVLQEAEAEEPL